jgi:hypothetical protein
MPQKVGQDPTQFFRGLGRGIQNQDVSGMGTGRNAPDPGKDSETFFQKAGQTAGPPETGDLQSHSSPYFMDYADHGGNEESAGTEFVIFRPVRSLSLEKTIKSKLSTAPVLISPKCNLPEIKPFHSADYTFCR